MKKFNVSFSSAKIASLIFTAKRFFSVQNGGDLNFGILVPYPVKNLSASSANLSVSLTWTAPDTDINGNIPLNYKVYRQGSLIATVTTLSYSDTLTSTGTYSYDVYANYSGNVLSSSSSVSVVVLNINPARNLVLTPFNGGANLTWSAPSSGTPSGYKIYRNGSLITTVTTLSYSNNVSPGTYLYAVVASYSSNQVDASAISGSVTVINYGSGTEADPYIILTVDDLIAINSVSSTGKFWKLMNNLDLSSITANGGWTPIGSTSSEFRGTFDGNGKVINGLYINKPSTSDLALFGVTYNATIKNLSMTNASVTGLFRLAILVGTANNSTINSCCVHGNITASNMAALLVCYSSSSTITNCYSRGDVSRISGSVNSNFALLIAYRQSSSITNNYAIGNVYYINATNPTDKGIGPSNSNTNYFDSELSNQLTAPVNNGLPKTTAQMKTQSTFIGWDFTTIWQIVSNINNGYPSLRIFN